MERVNRDHLQMIITRLGTSSYVNLLIPCEWQFMRPPGRPQQSNVLVKMLITSFQKMAMVSDGAEFAVGKSPSQGELLRRSIPYNQNRYSDSSPNKRVDNSQSRIKEKTISYHLPDRINTPDSSPDKRSPTAVAESEEWRSSHHLPRQSRHSRQCDKLATEFNVGKASVGDINEWMEEDGETAEFLTDDDIAAAVTQSQWRRRRGVTRAQWR
ncbi:hypothetical protein TNCV_3886991 [Trichonephila clavipes]|nr:hypothetical protein TNCV_3886991 [Trichonephila clavipes]